MSIRCDGRAIRSRLGGGVACAVCACALWIGGCAGKRPATPGPPAPSSSSAASSVSASTGTVTAPRPSEQGAPAPDNSAPTGGKPAAPAPKPDQSAARAVAVSPARSGRLPAVPPADRPHAGGSPPGSAAAPSAAKGKAPISDGAPPSKTEVAAQGTTSPAAVTPPAAASAPAQAVPASAPALDLTSLKQRLRDTSAIGVFTKLALKNQVDDLLDKFRGFYRGQVKITLPQLRQSYDLLVMKVLALLQDSDPGLAREIIGSREAIWGLLADPQKFATL